MLKMGLLGGSEVLVSRSIISWAHFLVTISNEIGSKSVEGTNCSVGIVFTAGGELLGSEGS